MRRLIILLLAVVVPIKAWAGVAHAFALKAGHSSSHAAVIHAGASTGAPEHGYAAADDECCFADDLVSALQSQDCPHLTMPLFAAPPPLMGVRGTPMPPPTASIAPLRSIVLDVLHRPPLTLR